MGYRRIRQDHSKTNRFFGYSYFNDQYNILIAISMIVKLIFESRAFFSDSNMALPHQCYHSDPPSDCISGDLPFL